MAEGSWLASTLWRASGLKVVKSDGTAKRMPARADSAITVPSGAEPAVEPAAEPAVEPEEVTGTTGHGIDGGVAVAAAGGVVAMALPVTNDVPAATASEAVTQARMRRETVGIMPRR